MNDVSIFDITGKEVFSKSVNAQTLTINTNKWKSGVYFVKIENQTIKVIKE